MNLIREIKLNNTWLLQSVARGSDIAQIYIYIYAHAYVVQALPIKLFIICSHELANIKRDYGCVCRTVNQISNIENKENMPAHAHTANMEREE